MPNEKEKEIEKDEADKKTLQKQEADEKNDVKTVDEEKEAIADSVQIPEFQPDGTPVKGSDGSIGDHLSGKHYIDVTAYHDVRAPKKERKAEFTAKGYVVIKEDDYEDLILVGKEGAAPKNENAATAGQQVADAERKSDQEDDEDEEEIQLAKVDKKQAKRK